jgi:hypothetical protein
MFKIHVLADGTVISNDEPTSLDRLAVQLSQWRATGQPVYYYRENAGEEPPASAIQVLQLIVDNRLPVSLSTQSDFSDYVDDRGQPHPRPVS